MRTLPESGSVERAIARGPHYKCPPGIVLRQLEPQEVNDQPVLVCDWCHRPTLHVRRDVLSACQVCWRERRW